MKIASDTSADCYRIGAVSRLTGLSVHTLRVWEARNKAVRPSRSTKGTRLYSAQDVERLKLMKQLIDAGDAISIIAGLSLPALKQRAEAMEESEEKITDLTPYIRCSLYVVGESMTRRLANDTKEYPEISIAGSSTDVEAVINKESVTGVDILVVEMPNIFEDDSIDLMRRWLGCTGARHGVIIYRFASQKALEQLDSSQYTLLKAPVTTHTVLHYCKAAKYSKPHELPYHFSATPPVRRFDDSALASLATQSTTVKCECPKHLAELVTSLVAFESYSASCESRNSEDATLHAYLRNVTAHARDAIEQAIIEVLKTEGITVDGQK